MFLSMRLCNMPRSSPGTPNASLSPWPLSSHLPSIYYPDFITTNQGEHADSPLPGNDKQAHLEWLGVDTRRFKADNELMQRVFWTANTERFAYILPGMNGTADNLLNAVKASHGRGGHL